MSCLSMAKKLLPAKKAWKSFAKKLLPTKKAWKSFANTLQSKLQKLKNSKAIKRTTNRFNTFCSIRRPLVSYKRRALDRPFSTLPHHHHHYHHHHHHHHHQLQKSISTIYVDELFAESVLMHAKHPHAPEETSKAKEMNAANGADSKAKAKADTASITVQQQPIPTVGIKVFDGKAKAGEKSTYDVNDAWKAAIASSPQLRGVDERAEDFISKFREEIKLQREKSILEYQEMLARSA